MSYCTACLEVGQKPKRGANVTIEFNPAIQMPGTPTIRGHRLAAEMVAKRIYLFGMKEVREDYSLTREECILACWWAGLWGPRKLKLALRDWAVQADRHLWYRCIQIPDPPRAPEVGHVAKP